METSRHRTDKIPLGVKIGYGAGAGSSSLIFTLFYVFGMFFLTDVVKMDPAFAGIVMMIGTFWDAFTDPAVGIWSDRTKFRWGRRRPFMFAIAIPFGVIAWLLFTDFNLSPSWTKVYFVLMVILYFTAYTVLAVPYNSLSAEMTQDYDERTGLVGYRAAWSQVFSIIGAGLPLILAQYFAKILGSQKAGWSGMAAVFGVVCIPLILIAWRSTRGYELFPEETRIKFRDIFTSALKNRPFLYTMGLYTCGMIGISVAGAVGMYFMTYNLGFSEKQTSLAFVILFGCTVFWIPFLNIVSSKLGKRWAWIIFIGGWVLVQSVGVMFILGPGMVGTFYLLSFLASGGLVCVTMIGNAMIADVVEVDEYKTGQRREGLYYGFEAFIQKAACALAIGLSGEILSRVGYIPDAPQTEGALLGIRVIYGCGTALFLFISIIFCYFLPMTKQKHKALREAIRLKAEGKEYDDSLIKDLL
jgi:sugar (glycoside-pentoside-hexuronide) transporter